MTQIEILKRYRNFKFLVDDVLRDEELERDPEVLDRVSSMIAAQLLVAEKIENLTEAIRHAKH